MTPKQVVASVISLALGGAAAAGEIAGYVLEQRGRWSIDAAPAPLSVGAALPAGARLAPLAPTAGDHITIIAVRSGRVLVARRCDASLACAAPVRVGDDPEARGTPLADVLDRIIARLAGDPDRYVPTLSRGSARLDDTVLSWNAGGVGVGALFRALPDGRYEARLATLRCRGDSACPLRPVLMTVEWRRDGFEATLPLLPPGLYEMVLSRPRGDDGPSQARCWVLLVPEAELEETRARHRLSLEVADAWGAEVDGTTKRAFSRALLDALAAP